MITVKELKEKLSEFPDDMIVVVSGYENGYDDIYSDLEKKKVYERKNKSWWDGDYRNQIPNDIKPTFEPNTDEAIDVVFLRSRSS